MSQITPDQVHKVAKLAKIALDEHEVITMAEQLSSVLTYMEKLNTVPTDDVAPTNQVTDQTMVLRQDRVSAQSEFTVTALLEEAPEQDDRGVKVPAVFS